MCFARAGNMATTGPRLLCSSPIAVGCSTTDQHQLWPIPDGRTGNRFAINDPVPNGNIVVNLSSAGISTTDGDCDLRTPSHP